MTNVNVPGHGVHNLVLVATVNDSIYAFDADDWQATAPYWQTNFLGTNAVPPRNTDMTGACGGNYQDFHGNMGIVGTPVIDPVSSTLYVVVRTKENGGTFVQRLRALDIATGLERPYSPVVITATYPGNGDGSVGGLLTFDPQKQNQRWGLALANGVVYVGWSSHCDWGPYHGWLMGFNATNLAIVSLYNTTPNGSNGGIWQGGGAPAIDTAGYVYFETGNGTFNSTNNNFGDSVLKLSTTNGLARANYFTPYDQANLESTDADLGSSGLVLLPDSVGSASHPHLLVASGKAGKIYLLDRDNLGQFNPVSDSQIVQSIAGVTAASFATPSYFNNRVYFVGSGDTLKAFALSGGLLSTTPVSQSPSGFGFPGATVSISANNTSNGIVWALDNSAWGSSGPAVLHAYNTTNVTLEIYNTTQAGTRDRLAGAVKFSVPTVANGKVYVGGQYALSMLALATFLNPPIISPAGGVFTNSVTVSISDSSPGVTLYYTLDGSVPTTNSLLYTAPFVVTNSLTARARAFAPGAVDNQGATASFVSSTLLGNGTGLTGSYYSQHFSTNPFVGLPTLVRTDAMVNFDWGSGPPAPSISATQFTVEWTGDVQPLFSEPYTFYTRTDDGVRLYVNGQLVVNEWVDQGATEWSGTINLTARQRDVIRMEYYQNLGASSAQLSWSSPSTPKQIVPTSQLYPVHNNPPYAYLLTPINGSSFSAPVTLTLSTDAGDTDGTVVKVDYFQGTNLLGTATQYPYYLTLPGVGTGTYSFTARATDDGGATFTTGAATIYVNAGAGGPYGLTNRYPAPPFLNLPSTAYGPMPTNLSQTGVFADTPTLRPSTNLIPYSPIVPFWVDGSVQTRWFVVPNNRAPYTANQQIGFAPTGEWTFPAGSVLVQHLDLVTDETHPNVRRRLETRLLVSDASNTVYGVSYKWRPDNTDADLLTAALYENILITNASGIRTQTWYYPAPADCLACHQPAANFVLGAKTRQLNRSFTYASTGVSDNELRTLNRLGLFYPALTETNIPTYTHLAFLTNLSATLEDRMRSYLDASCAACHRPGGTGPTIDARYDTPLTNQNIINAPLQSGDLGYDNARVVVPHDIWRSILYERMNSPDPDLRMPDMSGTLIDTNAVQLAVDWINSLPGIPALPPPGILPPGGSFVNSVSVTMQPPGTNAILRYTLDGSLPTTNSPRFLSAFFLTNSATVRAKAYETGFNESVAATASFQIRPPPTLSLMSFSNGQFRVQLTGLAGKSYVFEGSTNLYNWVSLSTNVAPSDSFFLLDPGASNFLYRFYRALELP
jgi:hypothetical protein